MKPNELRIGNLIHHNSENAKSDFIGHELTVLELTEKSITTFYIDLYGSRQIVRNRENYQPIPLTEGWLLKFGYLPCSFAENHFYTKGHVIWNCNGQFICDKNGVVLKYVHQLQNLYFAINENELTLKS